MKQMKSLLAILLLVVLMLPCVPARAEKQEHEPITIMDGYRYYGELVKLLAEKYPEIKLEIQPYTGKNTTEYMKKQLKTGILPDIYTTTQLWSGELQEANLVDLSQYAISDLYNPVRLSEADVDGAVYLLPYDFTIMGIWCNASLLERYGIAIPTSSVQLFEETIPAVKAEGLIVAQTQKFLPGWFFQCFFNLGGTFFFNTLEGRTWMRDFLDLSTDVTAADQPELQQCMELFLKWRDAGLLFVDDTQAGPDNFREGNTAFFVGTMNQYTQNKDGTGDQYVLLPYLSEDGTQNIYITQTSRAYGLNKALQEPGNEQKLEDAMHVLEVMSSLEGYLCLTGGYISTSMCSIRAFELPETSVFYAPMKQVASGHAMTLVYTGWDDYLTPFGMAMREVVEGTKTPQEALETLDSVKQQLKTKGEITYGTFTEKLSTVQTAQLVGQMFLDATDADAALISYNIYYPDVQTANTDRDGVNGEALPGEVLEGDLVIFLPTGWNSEIQTLEMTGEEANQLAAKGCALIDEEHRYPYVFLTRGGQPLDEESTYSVIICGVPQDIDRASLHNTGIVGLNAAKAYMLKVGEVSTATLDNSLVQSAGE